MKKEKKHCPLCGDILETKREKESGICDTCHSREINFGEY